MLEPRHCADCGAPLTDGLGSRCPRCLLAIALLEEDGGADATSSRFGAPGLGAFGDYELLEEIAHGGMGVVFKARQRSLGRTVAVKMIRAGRLASADEVQRFRAEAEAAGQLQHPNIVAIHEVGECEGQHFFSMDYVEGRSLADLVRDGPFPPDRAARYVKTLAEAVHYAHQHGVLHRDLKPSNVLIDAHDQPRITDFGLAKRLERPDDLTPSNHPLGTPGYMSPEQAAGKVRGLTTAADVYGLGAILYDLLTGCPPFVADTPFSTMRAVVEEEPVPPWIVRRRLAAQRPNSEVRSPKHTRNPQAESAAAGGGFRRSVFGLLSGFGFRASDLDIICLKCLEKHPARRYASAAALAEDLDRCLRHEPIHARPGGLWRHGVKWARRRPAVAALAATVMLAGTGFVAQLTASRARVQTALARMRIHVAEDYFTDNPSIGLAYLARVLRDDPGNAVAAERLLSALSQRHFLLPRTPPLRHGAAVNGARFSTDGRWVVTASEDGTARVWEAGTGQPAGPPLRHAGPVRWAEFSADGERVATASADGTARVWAAGTGQALTPPLVHRGAVSGARFSPNGRVLATASDDHTARVWEAGTGRPLTPPLVHGNRLFTLAFTPDGQRLVTAAADSAAHIWEVATGREAARLQHANWVCAATFSADGRWLATGAYDKAARVWDAIAGEPVTPPLQHRAALRSVEFSGDGRWLLTGTMSGTAEIWDWQRVRDQTAAARPAVLIELKGSALFAARFSPECGRLAVASVEGTVQLWQPATGQRLGEPMRHGGPVFSAEFSPDGGSLLTASADGTACLWDARQAPPLGLTLLPAASGDSNAIHDAVFSHDGRLAATASRNGEVRLWNTASGQAALPDPLRHQKAVNTVRFSPDDRRLLTASRDTTARLWDLASGKPVGAAMRHDCAQPGLATAEFSADGRKVVTGAYCGLAEVWEAGTGLRLSPLLRSSTAGDIRSAVFSPDGNWFATADDGGSAQIWSVTGFQPAGPALLHREAVSSVRFSRDGDRVLTASWDATARVWERASGQALTPPMRHQGRVVGAEFSPDGRHVVTAAFDHTARLWDSATGRPLTEPLRHGDRVLQAQFSADGRRVVTASRDGTARVWDARTGLPASEPLRHAAPVNTARFHPAGDALLTGAEDGSVRLWPLARVRSRAPGWLPALAEALGGQRLDDRGQLQPVPVDQLLNLRVRQSASAGDGVFARWADWFFAERAHRAALPQWGG